MLGVVFTALAHALFIRGMMAVKAQLASIIASLEPVYGILIALVVLSEVPSAREILGGVVIISAIVYATKNRAQTVDIKTQHCICHKIRFEGVVYSYFGHRGIFFVMPAQAGIQDCRPIAFWTPAFAGMTPVLLFWPVIIL